MSGAGRGTPRANFISGAPVPHQFIPGRVYPLPVGPWGYVVDPGGSSLELTTSYVDYATVGVPYGATRLGVECVYLPGATARQLGIRLLWRIGPNGNILGNNLTDPDLDSITYPSGAYNQMAEIPVYFDGQLSPASEGTPSTPYLFQFPVPPVGPAESNALESPFIRFDIQVREVGGAGGTVNIMRITAENFGQTQPVARR